MACVAPKNNSVVIKMNKPSTGFFKRHSLAGLINGSEEHAAAGFKTVCVDVDEWVDRMKSMTDTKVFRLSKIAPQGLL